MEFNKNFDDFGVSIAHYFGGGSYAKETMIPAGVELKQHAHNYDHLSILASGSVVVFVDGEPSEYSAPLCITIAANKAHSVTAITDVVWYCVHATSCADPDLIDSELANA